MAAATLGAVALLVPSQALAHALLLRAEPGAGEVTAAPSVIRLTFSEPITPFGRGLEVVSPSGRLLPGRATAAGAVLELRPGEGELREPGTYRVTWRVVARDTHPSRGGYTFSVDHPTPAPATESSGDVGSVSPGGLLVQIAGRWVHFLGEALTFGVLAFQFLGLREPVPGRRLRRLAGIGIVLLIIAEPLAVMGEAASLGSLDPTGLADALSSSFGRVAALRLGVALALWGLLGAIGEARWKGALLISGTGLTLAAIDGLGGHTITGLPLVAAYGLTAAHTAAMAVWLGGLVALVALSREWRADLPLLIRRFSVIAIVAALVLILSGAVLALAHLRAPADLAFTPYGVVLAVKMAVVGIALGAAYVGLRRGGPARPEITALAGVLALAALLTSLPPPR